MKGALRTTILSFFAFLAAAADASALTAASANDICGPTLNPCVVGASYDVTGPLDFGLRTVRIAPTGRLRGLPDVTIRCGEFILDATPSLNPSIEADGSVRGDVTITASRACSGNPTVACLTDAVCASAGIGVCTVGAGTITTHAKIVGTGNTPGKATLDAAGDVTIGDRLNFGATAAASDGGEVEIESFGGSVTATGAISAKSGQGGSYGYYGGEAGRVTVNAAIDIAIGGGIDAWGRLGGGTVLIESGRDVTLTSDIIGSGGGGGSANGGYVYVIAGRDIIVEQTPNGEVLQDIETDGGTDFYFYGYGGSGAWYSGYGGYQYWTAGEDIGIGANGRVHSMGGRGAGGGSIYFDAAGRIDVDGEIRAQGTPPSQGGDTGAGGGFVELVAGAGIRVGNEAVVATASPVHGGRIFLRADGPVELYGTIDVRGNGGDGPYSYSHGGYATIEGNADVFLSGDIHGGGGYGANDMTIDVCRLELDAGARIQNVNNPPADWTGNTYITIRESMIADANSKILADAVAGARNVITYRDSYKPPVLNGTVTPAPILATNPALVGCPVCGNFEIDQGESCDDGNTTSDDGCRGDCQDEGCLAESPGFPGTPICDDGDACTVDHCDAVGHTCTNVVSCDEGVACTVDSCVSGGCVHVAEDGLCNDRNDCTDDICNETTGCVHAGLTGGACEDGDFCTAAGVCDAGDCVVSDVSRSTSNQIRAKLAAGPANDGLKVRASLALADLTTAPTTMGMRLVVLDALDDVVFDALLGASDWEDARGDGLQFRFRDSQGPGGPANGVRSASVKRYPSKGIVKVAVSMKESEVPGAAGQAMMSASFLFGSDPLIHECTTARRVPCKTTATNTSCKG